MSRMGRASVMMSHGDMRGEQGEDRQKQGRAKAKAARGKNPKTCPACGRPMPMKDME